ncbi:MAG: hypothetical protein H7A24_08415, partial [Leptospiraceae bacterium]|nr:hypothetical protein [Leptospiraceae bacterium]
MSSNENKSGPDEDFLLEHRRQNEIYNRLYVLGKSLNEQLSEGELFDIAGKFVTGDLGYERCILFKHDDRNGWFKIDMAIGYQNPAEQKVLKIINLLLSGAVIEYLRKIGQPIIHSQENPNEIVRDLTKSLFLREAYFELFGGDVEIPYGLIVIGNGLKSSDKDFTSIEFDSMSRLALGNFITQFSNTINNIVFYQAWKIEKASLEENIIKRTRELTAQKETFEAIYKTSKDGIAILDVETT